MIVGRPNDGKSSIFANFLGDDEVAVSPIPGETKKMQPREISLKNSGIEIIDTPGIQHPETVYAKFKEYSESGRKPAAAFAEEFTDSKYFHDIEIMKALSDADICMLVVNADNFFGHTQRCLLDTFSMLGSATALIGVVNRKDDSFIAEWRAEFERRGIDCFDFDAFKSKFSDCAKLFDEICACEAFRRRTELREVMSDLRENRAALWNGNFDAAASEILNSLKDLMIANSRERMSSFSLKPEEKLNLKRALAEKIKTFVRGFRVGMLKRFKYSGIKLKAPDFQISESHLVAESPNVFSRIFAELPFVRRPFAECRINPKEALPERFVREAAAFVAAIASISYAQSATKEFELDLEKSVAHLNGIDFEKISRFAQRASKGDDSDSFYELQSELRTELRAALKNH